MRAELKIWRCIHVDITFAAELGSYWIFPIHPWFQRGKSMVTAIIFVDHLLWARYCIQSFKLGQGFKGPAASLCPNFEQVPAMGQLSDDFLFSKMMSAGHVGTKWLCTISVKPFLPRMAISILFWIMPDNIIQKKEWVQPAM